MARVFANDEVIIAKAMTDHLNRWAKKPTVFKLEDIGKDVPSLMLQQLSAAKKVKSYVDGSYIGIWNFSIYMRVSGEDTASRLDAAACLGELADWLTKTNDDGYFVNLPYIDRDRTPTSIRIESTPSIAARYEDGIEDYQAIFSLEYKARRN